MKTKNYLLSMLTIMMVAFGSFCLASCGNDDDDENNGGNEQNERWLIGTVRGEIKEYSAVTSNGEEYTYKSMEAIVFKDHKAFFYSLKNTESVPYLIEEIAYDGELRYRGTWTAFEGHPEWSYFNGQYYLPGFHTDNYQINPIERTYSLDWEKNCINWISEPGEWHEPYYFILNPAKTSWDELRNEGGWLMYIVWNDPLDNSKFEQANNQ